MHERGEELGRGPEGGEEGQREGGRAEGEETRRAEGGGSTGEGREGGESSAGARGAGMTRAACRKRIIECIRAHRRALGEEEVQAAMAGLDMSGRGGGQVTLRRPRYTQIDPSDRPCRRRWVGLLTPYPLGVGVLRPRRFTP